MYEDRGGRPAGNYPYAGTKDRGGIQYVNVEISQELVRVERWCFQRRGGKVGRSERRSSSPSSLV